MSTENLPSSPSRSAAPGRRDLLRWGAGGAAALSLPALLTACGAGSDDPAGGGEASATPVSASEREAALSATSTLTVWDWVSGVEKQTALFEQKYPNITVNLENVGNGAPHYAKVRTAAKAGSGGADVVQMEYQFINSFVVTGSLLDLAPLGGSELSSMYPEWVWQQVSRDARVYGIPGDQGPMGILYRDDLFQSAGVGQLATWNDFTTAASAVRAGGGYITNLPPNNPGELMGLFWQAGAKPFTYDGGKTVGVDLVNDTTSQVISYWQDLIDQDLVSVDPDFTDAWYQGLASGKYASWLTAAWGPTFLQGYAGSTAGSWRATGLPQWSAGQEVNGNWGGSSFAVMKTSKNPIAAFELAKFLNSDPTSVRVASDELFLYPTLQSVLEDPAFLDQPAAFYGGQTVNRTFADLSKTVDTDFDWLPYIDYAYTNFNDTLGKVISEKGELADGLQQWQEALVSYGEKQGFTIR
ncbi:extracellular solute-binding protein [Kineococcus sp. T13]|uniref:extracellular solute-binding protein n=1 Tax=Kineococcus vitellinus TaxID=2696565 RepID=UPI001412C42E|nr:extracellular solute-binding protein [Kineococcus vitellinus]NAZ76589.1 extracellular solute-binding protein [Kineococcus vitellinus]